MHLLVSARVSPFLHYILSLFPAARYSRLAAVSRTENLLVLFMLTMKLPVLLQVEIGEGEFIRARADLEARLTGKYFHVI